MCPSRIQDQRYARGRRVLRYRRAPAIQVDLGLPAMRAQLAHHRQGLPVIRYWLGPIAPAQVEVDQYGHRRHRGDREHDRERFVPGCRDVASLHTAGQHERRSRDTHGIPRSQIEQGRERRSRPTSVIPADVILIRVGTLPRSSNSRSTDSPLDSIPDRSGSSNASALSRSAI